MNKLFGAESTCAVIVSYIPNLEMINKMISNSYLFKKVYIIDNSEEAVCKVLMKNLEKYSNIEVIGLSDNFGIAYALNVGLSKAIEDNFYWTVTLDQDSLLESGYMIAMGDIVDFEDHVGIISPVHKHGKDNIERIYQNNSFVDVESVMMSGNLLSMTAYAMCGEFLSELFIDYVDIEYCLRLRKYGFRVILTDTTSVFHELGSSNWYRIGRFTAKPTNHSPIRRYYISRNRVYLYKIYKYDKFIGMDLIRFIKEVFFIVLFEKNKIRKLRATALGIYDGLRGKLGQMEYGLI